MDIAALRALAARATPGPWVGFNLADVFTNTHPLGEGDIHIAHFDPDPAQKLSVETIRANRELCMVARTALPLLCDEAERLREMVHPFTSRDELNDAFRSLMEQRDAAISGRAEMAEGALALAEKDRDAARAYASDRASMAGRLAARVSDLEARFTLAKSMMDKRDEDARGGYDVLASDSLDSLRELLAVLPCAVCGGSELSEEWDDQEPPMLKPCEKCKAAQS